VSSAASAEPRWLELQGHAVAQAELEAPLTGRRCLLYSVALGLLQRLRDGGGRARETAGLCFLVRTESGLLLVDPAAARLRLPTRLRARLWLGHDPARDARLRSLYQRLGRSRLPAAVAASEQRLEAGDRVLCAGWLEARPHAGGDPRGYRQPPQLPVLLATRLVGSRP